jgi:hypothetical protein
MGKLNYSISFRNGTNSLAPPREQYLELRIYGNNSGVPYVRMYEDGTPFPAYDSMTVAVGQSYKYFKIYGAFAGGKRYIVDYIDDAIEVQLFKFAVLNNVPGEFEGCIPYASEQEIINIQSSNGSLSLTYLITSNTDARQISIDGGATYRGSYVDTIYAGDRYLAQWSESELVALGYGGEVPTIIFKTGACQISQFGVYKFPQPTYTPLVPSYSTANITAAGANDGLINIGITGGSGSYSFAWDDGPTTRNRSGLGPGLYSIVITDTVTGLTTSLINIPITEPQPPPPLPVNGSVNEVPTGNPIRFVPTVTNGPQTLDNKLFCQQYYPGYRPGQYFNPIQKSDPVTLQLNVDFLTSLLELVNFYTGETFKTFPLVLKEENVGVTTDYGIRIQNHTTPGQSRVYFTVGAPPINLTIGNVFEIVNNADGFNGVYAIVDIQTDTTLGYNYIVITKNYAIPATSTLATGRFVANNADFNVLEAVIDLLDVPDGFYFMRLTSTSDNTLVSVSEPMYILEEHADTIGITYRNVDNAFGIVWNTGFTGFLRVPAVLFKRLPGGVRSVSRTADYKLVKINAKKKRGALLEVKNVPPYVIELLSIVLDCDYFALNGVPFQCEDGLGEPTYIERFFLATVEANVEQVDWVSGYNGDDVSSVGLGGNITTETGFLKR